MTLLNTRFRDIAERETKARGILAGKLSQFEAIEQTRKYLTPQEDAEKELINSILNVVKKNTAMPTEVCDPLFVGARELFNDGRCLQACQLQSHNDGVLAYICEEKHSVDAETIVKTALTIGYLIIDGIDAPPALIVDKKVGTKNCKTTAPDTTHPSWKYLTKGFYEAIGEARGCEELALLVLPILANEGDPDGDGGVSATVDVAEFAQVMRDLHEKGVTTSENQLKRRVNEALNRLQSKGDDGLYAGIDFDLPDFDDLKDKNIVKENVRLMGPMIVSAMFEELKAFHVVDHLVERFQRGTLSIGSGRAGRLLYRYWRDAPNRISEMERRTFYATTMGVPGGEADDFVNREFNELWLRFVSSVSEFVRQSEVDKLLRTAIPSPVSHQQVRKAARDLASNLSLHGYGMAFYAAEELQKQIGFMIKLLSDPEIRGNYGARDMWQVIDQVATLELGGAKNSSRYSTLATSGAIITAWLATKTDSIMSATEPVLDIDEIRHPPMRLSGQKATTHPNDYDLVNACELWLADTGTSDLRVEELSQPREAPVQTSRPIQVPTVVQDMLDGMGDLGVGFGRGH